MLISPLLLILEVWDDKPTCRKSWGGNLLVWSVGGKSFGFVGIDIECKNISISGDIGGFILSTK